MTTLADIKNMIESNPIILFMKGTPIFPQCGFSARTVGYLAEAITACGEQYDGTEFAFVNVLDDPDVRALLPQYANWPTFPQLYINGELIGGCDIVTELFETDHLVELVKPALTTQDA
ncbi:MAG: Grx4 family monothiol glutaredoxin [Gammaproteobacteria bacterium]